MGTGGDESSDVEGMVRRQSYGAALAVEGGGELVETAARIDSDTLGLSSSHGFDLYCLRKFSKNLLLFFCFLFIDTDVFWIHMNLHFILFMIKIYFVTIIYSYLSYL